MGTILLTFFNNFKKYIIGIIVLALLIWWITSLISKINFLQEENDRKDTNIENMGFDVEKTKTKNDELQYSVNALTLKSGELEHFSKSIYERLDAMNLKITNLKSVTNIDYNYTTNVLDTLKTQKIDENKFLFGYDKNNLEFTGFINIPKGYPDFEIPIDFGNIDTTKYPYVTDFKVIFSDSLLIAPEYQYKRSWIFWKKKTGVKLHIQSANPSFQLNKIQTFDFD